MTPGEHSTSQTPSLVHYNGQGCDAPRVAALAAPLFCREEDDDVAQRPSSGLPERMPYCCTTSPVLLAWGIRRSRRAKKHSYRSPCPPLCCGTDRERVCRRRRPTPGRT